MLSLYKRGRLWWARGSVNGRTVRVSLDTQIKEVAWRRLMDLELRGGRKAVRWEDFRKAFLNWKRLSCADATQRKYDFVLSRFGQYLTARSIIFIEEVAADTVSAYCTERMEDKHPTSGKRMGNPGMKSDLRLLHGMFAYALKCGHIAVNPVISTGLNTPPGTTLPFTQKELNSMLACPYVSGSPFRRALLLTFLYTGLRISDVSAMKRTAVNLDKDVILLTTQKRKKPVTLALHPDLKAALKEHFRALENSQRFSQYIFPTRSGRQRWTQSMDANLRRIFRHAGITKGHAHRFRDTAAVRLLEHGASLYDVSKILGITMRTAERHYSPWVKELQDRAARLMGQLDFIEAHEPHKASLTRSK